MRAHQFLSTVPRALRIAACAIVCCAVLIGVVLGITLRPVHCATAPHALNGLSGMGMGLLVGTLAAIWILCLGYVYADARRRAMPAVVWTLIAMMVPNLLGFLFYFALRRPLASPCPKCGHLIAPEQRFCAWCGYEIASSPPSQMPSQAPGAPS